MGKTSGSVINAVPFTVYVNLLLFRSNNGTSALAAAVLPSNTTKSLVLLASAYIHVSIVKSPSVPDTAPKPKSAFESIVQ